MKIIAVNIRKELLKKGAFAATESAWRLNENKFRENLPEFVIGVASGKIEGHYRLLDASIDVISNRLNFSLSECDKREIEMIDHFTNGKNLKYFVIKQKW